MKGKGSALMYGLGGLALGSILLETRTKALTQQLQATQQALQTARSETWREQEARVAAERSRDEHRRIANAHANAVAARDVEIQKLKSEVTKLRGANAKQPNKEDRKT